MLMLNIVDEKTVHWFELLDQYSKKIVETAKKTDSVVS